MEKNYDILKKYILYFIVFALVCLVGISNCFALSNNNAIKFYDNNGSSLTEKTTNYIQQIDESSATFTTVANSYGGAVMIQATTPLVQGHLYTLFINVGAESNGGMTEISSKNCIGVGSSYLNAINSYVNCNISPKYSQKSGVTTDKGRGLYFSFIANTNGAYILIPYTTQITCSDCRQYSYGFNLEDGGDTTGLTQQQVNNLITNQTTTIQNEISNMQQDISGSIDDMKDSVNENIENNLNTCIEAKDVHPEFASIRLTTTNGGSVEPSRYNDSGAYLDVSKYHNKTIRIMFSGLDSSKSPRTNYCFTTNLVGTGTKCVSSVIRTSAYTSNYYDVEVPENANHLYLLGYIANEDTLWVNHVAIQLPKVCTNKLDEANETSKGILGKIKDLFNLFNSDDIGDSADDGADFINDFNTNTFGLTSIVTAPLNLIQSLTSSTCTELRLPLPYLNNKYLILPCMTSIYSQYFGSFFTMYQTITYGIIAYWVIVRIFNQVKDFKNPEHDEIEVVDL